MARVYAAIAWSCRPASASIMPIAASAIAESGVSGTDRR
jgi:hypothetical protein